MIGAPSDAAKDEAIFCFKASLLRSLSEIVMSKSVKHWQIQAEILVKSLSILLELG